MSSISNFELVGRGSPLLFSDLSSPSNNSLLEISPPFNQSIKTSESDTSGQSDCCHNFVDFTPDLSFIFNQSGLPSDADLDSSVRSSDSSLGVCSMSSLKIPPPNFQGLEGEDPETFWAKFEQHSTFHKLTEDQKKALLPLLFKDNSPADLWYRNLSNDITTDYNLLKTAFKERFKPSTPVWVSITKLGDITQEVDETVEMYSLRLQRARSEVSISDDSFLSQFLKGLRKEIRNYVMNINPKNFSQAEESARLGEKIFNPKFGMSTTPGAAAPVDTSSSFRRLEGYFETLSTAVDQLNKNMEKLQLGNQNKIPFEIDYQNKSGFPSEYGYQYQAPSTFPLQPVTYPPFQQGFTQMTPSPRSYGPPQPMPNFTPNMPNFGYQAARSGYNQGPRKCFQCNSLTHLARNCPYKSNP